MITYIGELIMTDSGISSLNSSLFTTHTSGRSTITGPIAQRTQNKHTRRGDLRVPQPALIPTKRSQQPPNSGIARKFLAPIFLPGNAKRDPKNPAPVSQVTRRDLHQAIGISDNSSDSQPESDIFFSFFFFLHFNAYIQPYGL